MESAISALHRDLGAAEQRAAHLAGDLRTLQEATAEGPDDEHDPDGSTIGYERARIGALLASTREDVGQLRAALIRVEAGTYGLCRNCQKPIPSERLDALASTTLCVACARIG